VIHLEYSSGCLTMCDQKNSAEMIFFENGRNQIACMKEIEILFEEYSIRNVKALSYLRAHNLGVIGKI
jgi:hypothetical protein